MQPLQNSYEIAIYQNGYAEGKRGLKCRDDDYSGRDRELFAAGYDDGRAFRLWKKKREYANLTASLRGAAVAEKLLSSSDAKRAA